jgi:hypothetical protein
MANRSWKKQFNTLTPGIVTLHGVVKLGTSGATSSQTSKGFSVARTGVGIYTVTLDDGYAELLKSTVNLRTAGAAPTGTSGNTFTRNKASNAIDGGGKTFTFTAIRSDTQVAAEVENNAELEIEIVLRNSAVTY